MMLKASEILVGFVQEAYNINAFHMAWSSMHDPSQSSERNGRNDLKVNHASETSTGDKQESELLASIRWNIRFSNIFRQQKKKGFPL